MTFRAIIFVCLASTATLRLPATPEELHSIAEIEDFLRPHVDAIRDFKFKAVVQAVEPIPPEGTYLYIIGDERGHRTSFVGSKDELTVGDEVQMTGLIYNRVRTDPFWNGLQIVKTGKGVVAPVVDLAIHEIDTRHHNLCEIVTTGTVTEVCLDEADTHYRMLTLKDADAILQLSAPASLATNWLSLIGAQVRVQGLFERAISGVRKYSGHVLLVNKITVLDTPGTTLFDAPPLDTHFYQSPEELLRAGRRTACGEVLACWGRHSILLNATDGSLITIETIDSAPLPPVGAIITASGFPDTDRFHLFLARAVCRIDRLVHPTDEEPKATSIRQLSCITDNPQVFCADFHGELIALEGILRSVPSPDTPDRHAYVECDGIPLKIDFSSVSNAFQNVEIGSTVRITGRGIAQIESKTIFNRYPKMSSFMIVLRSPQDVCVLTRPSWWTTTRLLTLIGILLVGIAWLLARIWFQRRTAKLKLAERTRLAVELHDSLSQTLVGLACQVSATEDALDDKPEMVRPRLSTAKRILQSCRSELRQCLSDLRSDILNEKDFARALSRTIEPMKPFANVTIRFNAQRTLLDDSIAHATFAIVRELVANAIRHGAADNVRIAGTLDHGQLLFSVSDDGEGFDPASCAGIAEGHFGLNGIRERIKTLNGDFEIRSTPGRGTRASVSIPLNQK